MKPDDWDINVKLLIDASGSLEATKTAFIHGAIGDTYALDVHHKGDGVYLLEYAGETIGTLNQKDRKITGKIDMSAINDDFNTLIVCQLSRIPSAMYLLHATPKLKYDPQKSMFLTIDEFSD